MCSMPYGSSIDATHIHTHSGRQLKNLFLICSVGMFLSDMAGKSPLYKKYVNDPGSVLHLRVCF